MSGRVCHRGKSTTLVYVQNYDAAMGSGILKVSRKSTIILLLGHLDLLRFAGRRCHCKRKPEYLA